MAVRREVKARRPGRASRGRVILVAGAALACIGAATSPLRAQVDSGAATPQSHTMPFAVRWGKWATAALAVGLTALGNESHNDGNAAFSELVAYCRDVATCTIGPDGRYVDPLAEATYQRVVRDDRAARAWFLGGQVAAATSVILWVLDLARQTEPPNIPYSGLVVGPGAYGTTKIGWAIPF